MLFCRCHIIAIWKFLLMSSVPVQGAEARETFVFAQVFGMDGNEEQMLRKTRRGWWECAVVFPPLHFPRRLVLSSHPSRRPHRQLAVRDECEEKKKSNISIQIYAFKCSLMHLKLCFRVSLWALLCRRFKSGCVWGPANKIMAQCFQCSQKHAACSRPAHFLHSKFRKIKSSNQKTVFNNALKCVVGCWLHSCECVLLFKPHPQWKARRKN